MSSLTMGKIKRVSPSAEKHILLIKSQNFSFYYAIFQHYTDCIILFFIFIYFIQPKHGSYSDYTRIKSTRLSQIYN